MPLEYKGHFALFKRFGSIIKEASKKVRFARIEGGKNVHKGIM